MQGLAKVSRSPLFRTGVFASALIATAAMLGAASGGGGGGSVGMDAPSSTTPVYDPVIEYQKGRAALDQKNFKDASKHFGHVLSVDPRNANSHYLQGMALVGLGNAKKAAGAFEKATKYDARLTPAFQQLGVARARLGEMDKAKVARDALAQKLAECGETCSTAGELKAAIAAIDEAIAAGPQARIDTRLPAAFAHPADGDRSYLAAARLINQRRFGAAIDSLDDALKSSGPHPDVLTYLGFANRKLGNHATAERYYQAALAIAPTHRGALEYYGELKVERGDLAGARRHLALLDQACSFGCHQAEELRRWIRAGRAPES
ncbi:lipopolysaccharide assembly protein LapB [Sphingomonas sp. 28-62-11]|uniref:tetratricopeptide repeat protein n=1 Tax=Sphingomonas sp. 28-62-11 TaxID=1970432 RepID=UPI000BDA22DA|nr:MAG: hypothetical protein B7Y49_05510 [Sphingomonas sp. 28-62-11]